MNHVDLFSIPFVAQDSDVLLALFDMTVKGIVLLLLAAIVCQLLRRASAATRHLLWVVTLGAVLLVPVLSLLLPPAYVTPHWMPLVHGVSSGTDLQPVNSANHRSVRPIGSEESEVSQTGRGQLLTDMNAAPTSSASKPVIEEQSRKAGLQNWSTMVVRIWVCGVFLLLLPLAVGMWSNVRTARQFPTLTSGDQVEAVKVVAGELGIDPPRVHLGPMAAMPKVWGLLRGHLLLPQEAMTWDAARLRVVLLHELDHLRRRDPLTMLIGQITRALHWFNPLCWLAVRQLRIERERACDDSVLRGGVKPSDYAANLLDLVAELKPSRLAPLALCMADPSHLEGRLRVILDGTRNRSVAPRSGMISMVLAAGMVTCSVSIVQSADNKPFPQAVSSESEESAATPDESTDRVVEDGGSERLAETNFVVLPITTELQKYLMSMRPHEKEPNAKVFVAVDGEAIVDDKGMIDGTALNLSHLRKDLQPYSENQNGIVYFSVNFHALQPSNANEMVSWALQGFGKHAGFENARVRSSFGVRRSIWNELIEETMAGPDIVSLEAMIGNREVNVFPVRTTLSRYLTSNSDCVIDILKPIEEDDVPLQPNVREAMLELMSQLKPKKPQRLLIRVTSEGPRGRKAVDALMEQREHLTKDLGVEFISINHTYR